MTMVSSLFFFMLILNIILSGHLPLGSFQNLNIHKEKEILNIKESFHQCHYDSIRKLKLTTFHTSLGNEVFELIPKFKNLLIFSIGFKLLVFKEFKTKHNLKTIEIYKSNFLDEISVQVPNKILKGIQVLKINLEWLFETDIRNINLILLEYQSSLQKLELLVSHRSTLSNNLSLFSNIPKLRSLTISNTININNANLCNQLEELILILVDFENIDFTKFTNIKQLQIIERVSENSFLLTPTLFPELINLFISQQNMSKISYTNLKAPNLQKLSIHYTNSETLESLIQNCPKIQFLTLLEPPKSIFGQIKATSRVLFGRKRISSTTFKLNFENVKNALEKCQFLKTVHLYYERCMNFPYEIIQIFSFLSRVNFVIISKQFKTFNVYLESKEELFKDDQLFRDISEGHGNLIDIFDGVSSKKVVIYKDSFVINVYFNK